MKVELMRYKNDSVSFYMNILAIVFNVVFLICIMANLSIVADYVIGLDALVNIIFMLFAFLTAEKVKAYLPKWCFVSLVLAVVQLVRIFVVALPFAEKGQLTGFTLVLAIVSMVASIGCLIAGFVVSFIRSKALKGYLEGLADGTRKDTIIETSDEIMEAMTEVELTTDDSANG